MSSSDKIMRNAYNKPAGGWDALASSFKALREHGIVGKGASTLLKINHAAGFDCPGCAWPDRNPNSTFEFCENGVKAVAAEATSRRVTREFFAAHPVRELMLQDDFALESNGRLTEPMRYNAENDRYEPIAWDAAFALIARHLQQLDTPHQALFYTSGRTSNEAAFLYQLFVREFGTNNLPDCSNMCHEASGIAMTAQLGVGKGTVTLDDFEHAEAIFIFGQNPGTNHPRMLGELRDAAKRGCKIVVFNPLRERGLERFTDPKVAGEMLTGGSTELASHYYTPIIGGDLAAVMGMIKHLIDKDDLDHAFISEHTEGFDELRTTVQQVDWGAIETQSGLSRAHMIEAAEVYRRAKASIVCWGMGITQHRRSVATIQTLVNLLLLKGNIGKRGAGACPVRGHSNVQGDRTMGIYEKPSAQLLDRIAERFGFQPPREHGLDVVGAIDAMQRGTCRVFFALGGNFAAATPDSEFTAKALKRCDLTVQVSTKLNRSHLVHGKEALILPCLGRTEIDLQASGAQSVTVEDSMSMVHLSAGMNVPASRSLLSEPAIVARLATATLPHSKIPWLHLIEDYDRIRELIADVIDGFEQFNERVKVPGGFWLGNAAARREWKTRNKKASLMPHALLDPVHSAHFENKSDAETFTLTTIRSHDQYNTTIYGLNDRYRGIHNERRVCFISTADLQRLNFKHADRVDLISVWSDGERVAKNFTLIAYPIPAGCLAAYFPETNPLVPLGSHGIDSRTPTSKAIRVYLRRAVDTFVVKQV